MSFRAAFFANLLMLSACALAGDRVALVISNTGYGEHRADPRAAKAMAESLLELGFEMRTEAELTVKELEAAIHAFLKKAPTNSTAVVHFSGLGMTYRSGQKKERVISIQGAGAAKDAREAQRQDVEIGKRLFDQLTKISGARTHHIVLDVPIQHPTSEAIKVPAAADIAEIKDVPERVSLHVSAGKALAAIKAGLAERAHHFVSSPAPRAGTKAGEQWVNGQGMVFCWCPAGTFTMGLAGQKDTAPVKAEITRGFWIAKYELTQREYRAIRGKDPNAGRVLTHRNAPAVNFGNGSPNLAKKLTEIEREAGRLTSDWEYRVQTEAQWEYACRAASSTTFCYGDSPGELHRYANFADRSLFVDDPAYHFATTGSDDGVGATLALVGSYRPNAWGIHDMHGNVSEWCREFYFPELLGGKDPYPLTQVKEGEKVVRGGAWCSLPEYCSSGFRNSSAISNNAEKLAFLGVRFVLVRSE